MQKSLSIWLCCSCLSLLSIQGNLRAQQVLSKRWTAFHDGALMGYDHSNALVCDNEGNVFVTGQSFQNSATGSITTVMYDANGNTIWADNYKGVIVTVENEGKDICMDPFGNVLVTGTVAWNDGDFSIIKYDRYGRVWAKDKEPYSWGSGTDFAKEIATDVAGNIYCVASIQSLSGNMQDVYTLKCDSAGNDLWSVDYSSASGDDWAEGLAVSPDGHCFSITSSFNFFGSATYDIQTIHYDSAGTQQWLSSSNFPSANSEDYPLDIQCDEAFNTWVCGVADGGSNSDMTALKQNEYGTRLWTVTYNGSANSHDTAIAISYLPNKLTVVTGKTRELVIGSVQDVITTMLIDSGVVLWTNHFYGDSLNAYPTAMTTDSLGNIYICGYYQSHSQGLNGVLLVYDQTGVMVFYDQYDGIASMDDRFNDLVVDHQNFIYVTGQSYTATNNSNYVTIKYAMSGLNNVLKTDVGSDFVVYPSPGSNEIFISGSDLSRSLVKIADVSGKVWYMGSASESNNFLRIQTSGLVGGIYYVQVSNEISSFTKKLIIQ